MNLTAADLYSIAVFVGIVGACWLIAREVLR
jgi:hypothetical protein